MKRSDKFPRSFFSASAMFICFALAGQLAFAQESREDPSQEPADKKKEKAEKSEKAENPAQIELLETKVRFESNGDSRKEVHALVKINSELGMSQFARLNFDFNRSFESVEIPLVHITHASGGTTDILPSAISDQPNPAVVNAPPYQDVRVKSVRILGLQPGDTLEYRVIKTVSHHPLAPDFWLDHTFDRTGVVTHEVFDLELPAARNARLQTAPGAPATSMACDVGGVVCATIKLYHWERDSRANKATCNPKTEPDIVVTTFSGWAELSKRLALLLPTRSKDPEIQKEAEKHTAAASTIADRIEALYDFVSQKITTIDLPLGATGFRPRKPSEILASGFATPEDKFTLFAALAYAIGVSCSSALAAEQEWNGSEPLPRPTAFDHQLIWVDDPRLMAWLDPSLAVAPFGFIPSNFRGKRALVLALQADPSINSIFSMEVPQSLPFSAFQKVNVDATISRSGTLSAKVQYALRGDNELLLRVTFHQSAKDKWKKLAQLLSLTDGFRGQVTSVSASDPYTTKEPFTVEYELEQPKFVDWSKKTVRIPALLPQLGLPDPPAKPLSGVATAPIELGTPLEVETRMTLHLPPGATATAPAGTTVKQDYATYSAQYSAIGSTLMASRHIKFLLRQVPGTRAADYNAFLHAVQSDEAQSFTLEGSVSTSPKVRPSP